MYLVYHPVCFVTSILPSMSGPGHNFALQSIYNSYAPKLQDLAASSLKPVSFRRTNRLGEENSIPLRRIEDTGQRRGTIPSQWSDRPDPSLSTSTNMSDDIESGIPALERATRLCLERMERDDIEDDVRGPIPPAQLTPDHPPIQDEIRQVIETHENAPVAVQPTPKVLPDPDLALKMAIQDKKESARIYGTARESGTLSTPQSSNSRRTSTDMSTLDSHWRGLKSWASARWTTLTGRKSSPQRKSQDSMPRRLPEGWSGDMAVPSSSASRERSKSPPSRTEDANVSQHRLPRLMDRFDGPADAVVEAFASTITVGIGKDERLLVPKDAMEQRTKYLKETTPFDRPRKSSKPKRETSLPTTPWRSNPFTPAKRDTKRGAARRPHGWFAEDLEDSPQSGETE